MNNYALNQKTMFDELNDLLTELFKKVKKFTYKNHWVLGYF